jgi:putative two-component system response regulator
MIRLLIVEKSVIICAVFKRLLNDDGNFLFDIAHSYAEAEEFLSLHSYDYAVGDRTLPDAKDGKVISLLNKHGIAPIVYTKEIDEEFVESFESANIIDYILKHRHDNVVYVLEKLKQLEANKKTAILIANTSLTYVNYLKNNLEMHNFQVIAVSNGYEAFTELDKYPNIKLMIVDKELADIQGLSEMNGLELVRKIRETKNHENLSILSLANESTSYTTSFFLNEGADDFLIMPFSRDEFYKRIYQNLKD